MNLNTKKFSILNRTLKVFLFTLAVLLIAGTFLPALPDLFHRVVNLSGFYLDGNRTLNTVKNDYNPSGGKFSVNKYQTETQDEIFDRSLNRAEAIKLVVVSRGTEPNSVSFTNCFKDVRDEWFAPYVCYAKSKKWIAGYPDGFFRPGEDIKKTDAVKILLAVFGLEINDNPFVKQFIAIEPEAKAQRAQFIELIAKMPR